jgi:hypothetical protein
MGRSAVTHQPGQGFLKTPSQPMAGCGGIHLLSQDGEDYSSRPEWAKSLRDSISIKGWVWWHAFHPSYGGSINRRVTLQAQKKKARAERTGGMAEAVECLPSVRP